MNHLPLGIIPYRNMRFFIFLIAIIIGASSCTINKDIMFKTDSEYVFDTPKRDTTGGQFRLAPNDIISFDIFTNEGSVIIEASTARERVQLGGRSLLDQYTVRPDGQVELPLVGLVYASGKSIVEFQAELEQLYAKVLVNPYCVVRVINRRVLVFTGNGSSGTVVGLENNNVRLIEALALAGGLQARAHAGRIKLMRKVDGEDQVYRIDLSRIEGLQQANMIVENGDIIYVEPTPSLAREFLADVAPVVQFASTLVLLVAVLSRF